MFNKKIVFSIILIVLFSGFVWASDLYLEDINFPFDSAAVVDDLKQIPRLAEKLKQNPGLMLEITGHADSKGSVRYNNALSLKRANAVKGLITAAGVAPERIVITALGEDQPKEHNRNRDGRFVNRRVVFSLYYIKDGNKDYIYRDNVFIKDDEQEKMRAVVEPARQGSSQDARQMESLDDIVKRLDRIEETLQKKPLETTQPVREEAPVAKTVVRDMETTRDTGVIKDDRKATLSFAPGVDDGRLAGSVEGKVFIPINEMFAFQGGLRGTISNYLQEYQLDAGIIGKIDSIQLGLIGSSKLAKLKGFGKTANLSQLSVVASYLFDRGSIGAFATKGIKTEDVILTEEHYHFSDLIITETYLKLRDKYGVNFDYLFANGLSVEADFGLVNADNADTSGRIKVGYPIRSGDRLRVFVQGGYNGGLIRDSNDVSAMMGLELGNWKSQSSDMKAGGIRPMQVPDISYEMKTRTKVLASGVNHPPVVSISASPVSGLAPLTVTFTGHATDADGTIESMSWNFGDGSGDTGHSVTHRFDNPGTYLVTLTATDNKGSSSYANIQIKAENTLPVAFASGEQYGAHIKLDGSKSFDPDGGNLTYEWRQVSGQTVVIENRNSVTTYCIPPYTTGTYGFQLIVRDPQGGLATDTVMVSVNLN